MALFKPFRGTRSTLPTELRDGYAYFCTDDGSFHIDYTDADGNLQRKQINAKEAEKLTSYSVSTILNSSDIEIPTSKVVLDAISSETAGSLKYTEQTLTDIQKAQARKNIDAVAMTTTTLTKFGDVIYVDDTSPIEHTISVKIESKNLFTTDYYKTQYGTSNRKLEGNNFEFTSDMDAKGQSLVAFDIYLEAGSYYLSGDDISTSNSAFKGGYSVTKDNAFVINRATSTTIDSTISITEAGTYTFNFYGEYAADSGTVYTYSNIQLEKGSTRTDFAPLTNVEGVIVSKLVNGIEVQSAIASVDGTVEGLTSSSPNMEIKTNVEDGSVLISLSYVTEMGIDFCMAQKPQVQIITWEDDD